MPKSRRFFTYEYETCSRDVNCHNVFKRACHRVCCSAGAHLHLLAFFVHTQTGNLPLSYVITNQGCSCIKVAHGRSRFGKQCGRQGSRRRLPIGPFAFPQQRQSQCTCIKLRSKSPCLTVADSARRRKQIAAFGAVARSDEWRFPVGAADRSPFDSKGP